MDRDASPPTRDAFADDPLADAEWTAQYENDTEKEKQLEKELTETLKGSRTVSEW